MARPRYRAGKDVQQISAIKDGDGNVLTSEESVLRRWKDDFEELINEENESERRVGVGTLVNQEVQRISKEEVNVPVKRMKSGWSTLHTCHLRCLGDWAVELLTMLILESERMLEEWRNVMVTIFKNKVMCRAVVMTEADEPHVVTSSLGTENYTFDAP